MKNHECRQAAELAGYVQGELEAEARAALEAHLAGCDACRAVLEDTRRVMAVLRAAPEARVSRDLAPAVLARIAAEPVASRAAWMRGLAAAAGLVLLLTGLVWWQAAGKARGGGKDPVAAAAAWLCETQEPDGSWSTARWGGHPRFEVALTGLSLMALLQGGVESGQARAAVDRATDYLIRCQDENGRLGPAFDAELYNQGIATLALARAFQSRKTGKLRLALDRAVARIEALQHGDGGWGYQNTADRASNLSISLWQVEALRLAGKLGWESGRGRAARGLRWMTLMVARNGSFGYRQPGDFPQGSQTLTAMGAMSLMDGAGGSLLNPGISRAIRVEVGKLAADPGPDMDYYRRYFLTAALKKMGEESSARRLEALRTQLAAHQVASGAERGSWPADDQWSAAGGRIYATAMASLSLQ